MGCRTTLVQGTDRRFCKVAVLHLPFCGMDYRTTRQPAAT